MTHWAHWCVGCPRPVDEEGQLCDSCKGRIRSDAEHIACLGVPTGKLREGLLKEALGLLAEVRHYVEAYPTKDEFSMKRRDDIALRIRRVLGEEE